MRRLVYGGACGLFGLLLACGGGAAAPGLVGSVEERAPLTSPMERRPAPLSSPMERAPTPLSSPMECAPAPLIPLDD